jgi:hypothetical protein
MRSFWVGSSGANPYSWDYVAEVIGDKRIVPVLSVNQNKGELMKVIPAYVHGIFDYIGGLTLLAAPNLFGFAEYGGPAVMIPRVLGVVVLLMALSTRYEVGLFKVVPMRAHLAVDYAASLFLAASPWLFGFNTLPKNAWVPHVIVGLLVFFVTLMTEPEPRHEVARTAAV